LPRWLVGERRQLATELRGELQDRLGDGRGHVGNTTLQGDRARLVSANPADHQIAEPQLTGPKTLLDRQAFRAQDVEHLEAFVQVDPFDAEDGEPALLEALERRAHLRTERLGLRRALEAFERDRSVRRTEPEHRIRYEQVLL